MIPCLIFYLSPILGLSNAFAAEQSLRVSPVIINVLLSPGKVSSQEASIENLSDHPIPLRATLNDFITSGEEGGYIFENTKENPLLSWIKLSETEFILKPKEKKTIQLKITTPQSIPLGGYYGVLFFEHVIPSQPTGSTQIMSKVGILMLANIGVPDQKAKKAEILAFNTDLLNQDGTVPFLLRVQNISLNFFTAKPVLKITPIINFSSGVKEFPLEEKIIFPGKVRRWTENNQVTNLSPNIYKAQIEVSSGNGQIVTQETYFIVFAYMKAFWILLGLLILIFILTKRKRFKKALIALFRP